MEDGTILARVAPLAAALPDAELVRRIRSGEPALFELLMRRHNTRVYRAIRGLLGSEADVEDAMQQTYLLAYARLDEFAGAAAFSTRSRASPSTRRSAPAPRRRGSAGRDGRRGGARGRRLARGSGGRARGDEAGAPGARSPVAFSPRRVLAARRGRDVDGGYGEVLGISEDLVKVRLHRARHALRHVLAAAAGHALAEAFPFLAPRCDRVAAAVMARIRRRRPRGAPPSPNPRNVSNIRRSYAQQDKGERRSRWR